MGVSTTRSGPNSVNSPSKLLNVPPAAPTSSPITKTVGSRRISSEMASLSASAMVISRIWVDIQPHLARIREGSGFGKLHRVVHFLLDLCADGLDFLGPADLIGQHLPGEQLDRVAVPF